VRWDEGGSGKRGSFSRKLSSSKNNGINGQPEDNGKDAAENANVATYELVQQVYIRPSSPSEKFNLFTNKFS
jgi:hypothetical protein